MVALITTHVNARRRGDISRDGFDRDISLDASSRPLIRKPAGVALDIDVCDDTATRPRRAELASRGDTFAASHQEEQATVNDSNHCLAYSSPRASEESPRKPSIETRRRYDLKHAVVRMLRTGLREDERSHAVCGCGAAAYDRNEDDGTRLQIPVHRNDAGRAWVSGVYRCKSGWLCPTCAPAVARKRQQAVQDVVNATTRANGVFLMGLVTVRHVKMDRLADVKKLVTDSFAAARRQKNWASAEDWAGVAGVLVAPEVTFGHHGWHFHLHFGLACLPIDGADDLTDAQSEQLEDAALAAGKILIANFRNQVAKRGGQAVDEGQGIQIAASGEAAADYIAKGTSWELAGGTAHKTDATGQTIWEIVDDADAGDVDAYARFREYAEVMPGTRSCIITKKLRENLRLPADDESEGGEQQFDDGGRVVGHLDTFTWLRFLRAKLAGTFLSQIESVSGTLTLETFDKLVAEMIADADKQEGVITLKRAAKIQKSAADVEAGRAATQIMLTRNVAYRIRSAPAIGKVYDVIAARIETLRAEGHPEAALPTPAGVVAEIARMTGRDIPSDCRLYAA